MTLSRKKKIVLSIVAVPVFCLAMVLLGAALLFLAPEMIVNSTSVRLLLNSGLGKEQWHADDLSINVVSDSLRKKTIRISATDACFSYTSTKFCSEAVYLQFGVDLIGRPVLIDQIGPIATNKSRLTVTAQKLEPGAPWNTDAATDETSIAEWLQTAKQYLKNTRVAPIKARRFFVSYTDLGGKDTQVEFSFDTSITKNKPIQMKVAGRSLSGLPLGQFRLDSSLAGWGDSVDLPLGSIDAEFDAEGQTFRAGGKIEKTLTGSNLSLSLERLIGKQLKEKASLKASVTKDGFRGSLGGEVYHPADGIDVVRAPACRFTGRRSAGEVVEELSLESCRIELVRRKLEIELHNPDLLVRNIFIGVEGSIKDIFGKFSGDLTLELEPIATDLYLIESSTKFSFDHSVADLGLAGIDLNTDSKIVFRQFDRVVSRASDADFILPAPLNSLQGAIGCDVKGKISLETGKTKLPHRCYTMLSGDQQRLQVRESGDFHFHSNKEGLIVFLDSTVILEDVDLWLPNFSFINSVPSLVPDSRIVSENLRTQKVRINQSEEKVGASAPFQYDIKIKTTKKPALVHLPYYESKLPIHVDVRVQSDKQLEGEVRFDKFTLKVVEREFYVNSMDLTFKEDATYVDMQARIKQNQFDIILDVMGPTSNPNYVVTSDPPQGQEQIMSSVLYGGDGAGSPDNRAVAQTQAAMADGAVGLLSFFYLASTPVERVGYNPQTGAFSADVKIKDGTSIVLGSDFEEDSKAGIRKRIFGNWSLETVAVRNRETGTSKGVAMLRWAKRY